jgi:hypothetical protein
MITVITDHSKKIVFEVTHKPSCPGNDSQICYSCVYNPHLPYWEEHTRRGRNFNIVSVEQLCVLL